MIFGQVFDRWHTNIFDLALISVQKLLTSWFNWYLQQNVSYILCHTYTYFQKKKKKQQLYEPLLMKASYHQSSWNLEAVRCEFGIVWSPWNLTGPSAAVLLRDLSSFRVIGLFQLPISWLLNFPRSDGKTSYHLNRRLGIFNKIIYDYYPDPFWQQERPVLNQLSDTILHTIL